MKLTSTIKFFMNPAPFIFLTIMLGFLNVIGVGISWPFILLPLFVWAIYFCVIVSVLLWTGFKILGKIVELTKAS